MQEWNSIGGEAPSSAAFFDTSLLTAVRMQIRLETHWGSCFWHHSWLKSFCPQSQIGYLYFWNVITLGHEKYLNLCTPTLWFLQGKVSLDCRLKSCKSAKTAQKNHVLFDATSPLWALQFGQPFIFPKIPWCLFHTLHCACEKLRKQISGTLIVSPLTYKLHLMTTRPTSESLKIWHHIFAHPLLRLYMIDTLY